MKKRYAIIALAMIMMLAISLPVSACGILYTQGFWKNHEELWDEEDEIRLFQTDTLFFGSGKTYLEILNAPPKRGDAYLILGHQYIAAMLNMYPSGASVSATEEVMEALGWVETHFDDFGSGVIPANQRGLAIYYAYVLDEWNNGN